VKAQDKINQERMMNRNRILSKEDRDFFRLVRQAIIANPFSEERLRLDITIAAFPSTKADTHNIENTLAAIEDRIVGLEKDQKQLVAAYSGEDRQLMETAVLFWFFYRFRGNFDGFIRKQILSGETPIKLDFFDEVNAFLKLRGFPEEEIQRAIEHSYQFRRAFHFINRNLIGKSPVMKKLRYDLWNNIFTHNVELYRRFLLNRMEDFSTLILGETGTGKGTVASAIGRSGYIPFDMSKKCFVESFMQSFLSINLSQFSESLIESELFGHKKGAFTGAVEDYLGIFGRCSSHGAIFLDEIGETSHPIQIKLLQVLQDRVFYPVGSRQQERFQGRVIAATNRPLKELRHKKVFRDDFYYRMCSDIISVPSLRQRIREDSFELEDLLDFIVKRIVGEDSGELMEIIKDTVRRHPGAGYPWYGNVRELEQCVRRVILKKEYRGEFPEEHDSLDKQICARIEAGDMPAGQLMAGYCRLLYERFKTYEEVARITGLDRRTVTKHIKSWSGSQSLNGVK
jgi:DNA-binding NtrC family response regulator